MTVAVPLVADWICALCMCVMLLTSAECPGGESKQDLGRGQSTKM